MASYRYGWVGVVVAGHHPTRGSATTTCQSRSRHPRARRFNGRSVVVEVLRPEPTRLALDPNDQSLTRLEDEELTRLGLGPTGPARPARAYLRLTNEYRLPWRVNDVVIYLDRRTQPVVRLNQSSWAVREWFSHGGDGGRAPALLEYLRRTEPSLDRRLARLTELSVRYARYREFAPSLPDQPAVRAALLEWYHQQFVRGLRLLGLTSAVVEAVLAARDPWTDYQTLLTTPWRLVYLDSETLLWLVRGLRLTVDNDEYRARIAYQPLYQWLLQRGMIPWTEVYQRLPNLQHLTQYRSLFGVVDWYDHATTTTALEVESLLRTELVNRVVRHQLVLPAEPTLALDSDQRRAVLTAATNAVSCLLGPAGTGKTTALRAICALSDRVLLTSLTGKACRRLTEVCQRPAKTIHALLYRRVDDVELVVVDEVSMVGPSLLVRLLKRLPRNARLVLAGDFAQLPPVSEPSLLSYLAGLGLPTTRLTTCHRSERLIYDNCQQLREPGPVAFRWGAEFEYQQLTSDQPAAEVVARWAQRVGARDSVGSGATGASDFKVITPYRAAAEQLNSNFDQLKTGTTSVVDQWDTRWFLGEKVMMTVNNYQVNVMNGDEGVVVKCGPDALVVEFEPSVEPGSDVDPDDQDPDQDPVLTPRVVEYRLTGEQYHGYDGGLGGEGADLTLNTSMLLKASAITVHKAQGSEWDEVWCYLPWWSGFVSRRLLYTALTRARRRIVILTPFSQARLAERLSALED